MQNLFVCMCLHLSVLQFAPSSNRNNAHQSGASRRKCPIPTNLGFEAIVVGFAIIVTTVNTIIIITTVIVIDGNDHHFK